MFDTSVYFCVSPLFVLWNVNTRTAQSLQCVKGTNNTDSYTKLASFTLHIVLL